MSSRKRAANNAAAGRDGVHEDALFEVFKHAPQPVARKRSRPNEAAAANSVGGGGGGGKECDESSLAEVERLGRRVRRPRTVEFRAQTETEVPLSSEQVERLKQAGDERALASGSSVSGLTTRKLSACKHTVAIPCTAAAAAAAAAAVTTTAATDDDGEQQAEPQYDLRRLEQWPPKDRPSAKEYSFALDSFQVEACKCLELGESVLVAAHTSAGKTAVAEYAIALSLRDRQRVIYTSPIKALSNQKYRELVEEFKDVGLMTGDVTINPAASCLVMTTEILRSMLYRGSEVIREVAWVIFDEVHYMRDRERGVVWEETIILLPSSVRFVFLSATIPNAAEFSEWVAQLHEQPCHTVYTDSRPVPLQHYLFPSGGKGMHLVADEKGALHRESLETALSQTSKGRRWAEKARRGGDDQDSDCFKVVKTVMDRNLDPVIVFSFSRRECEQYAMQVARMSLNTREEMQLVQEVYDNAMAALSEEDRKLPQIASAVQILKRGVGIHHSGLLPILREVIEILFSEGLIKALFATETFAMGVNMPARTVLFTAVRKFDGQEFRFISGGEYIQMSGRAGRRGRDERGTVILIADDRLNMEAVNAMLGGDSDPLRSTFKLGYNMLLNLFRTEEADPEHMISRSFAQFQADANLSEKLAHAQDLKREIDAIPLGDEQRLHELLRLRTEERSLSSKIASWMQKLQYAGPFLQPGRLVYVNGTGLGDDHDVLAEGWAVLIQSERRWAKGNDRGAHVPNFSMRLLIRQREGKRSDRGDGGAGGKSEAPSSSSASADASAADAKASEAVWIPVWRRIAWLCCFSSLRLKLPADMKKRDACISAGRSVAEIESRYADLGGVPLLDPVQDLGIHDSDFKSMLARREEVRKESAELAPTVTSSFAAASAASSATAPDGEQGERSDGGPQHNVEDVVAVMNRKYELEKQLGAARRAVHAAAGGILEEQLKCMKRVLRRLGHLDGDDIITTKGRTCCEINTADELVLTELIFNGAFNDMAPESIVATLSCFVYDEKADESLDMPAALYDTQAQLDETAHAVGSVLRECKIPVDVEEFVESFQPSMMPVVYHWCRGASFATIMSKTTIFEGSVIRSMRRLEELLRQLCAAAKSIGNTELEAKFEQCSSLLKRDIVFAASLYL